MTSRPLALVPSGFEEGWPSLTVAQLLDGLLVIGACDKNLPGGMLRVNITGGTAANTHSWQFYRNYVNGCNFSESYGGALYVQAKGGTYHHAWGNYGFDCRNGAGTGGLTFATGAAQGVRAAPESRVRDHRR